MKIILTTLLAATIGLFAPKQNTCEAIVNKQGNYFIFVKSVPKNDYTSLGVVNMPMIYMNGKPKEVFEVSMQRAKKQYPNANGLIYTGDNLTNVEAIIIE